MGSQSKVTKKVEKERPFDLQVFLSANGLTRTVKRYRPNQIIFSQGEPCDAVFHIQEGEVKLTVISKQGKEAVIAMLGQGDFIAEACLTGQKVYLASATPVIPSAVMKIAKSEMLRALQEKPEVSGVFITYLLSRNRRIEEDLIDQLFNSGEKRLARTLLLLAHYGKEGKPEEILAQINQETLAKMIGVTRERVNFFMNKFKRLGFIDYNNGLRVHSSLLDVVLND